MTLKQMMYYKSVCNTLNITKSAEELYISQPALSLAMKELETEVGITLFQKSGTKFTVTDAGLNLLREIDQILEQYHHLEQMIHADLLGSKSVRFGFSSIVGNTTAPILCKQFFSDHPDIHINSVEKVGKQLIDDLEAGKLDVVLTGEKYSEAKGFEEKYNILKLDRIKMVFCVSKDSPYAKKNSITLEEISNMPVVMMDTSFPASRAIERQFLDEGHPLNILIRTFWMFTVERFISYNVAGGFLPEKSIAGNSNIVSIPCEEMNWNTFGYNMLYWKKTNKSQIVKDFVKSAKSIQWE